MKYESRSAASSAATAFSLCLCMSLTGCGDSRSGIPYSQLAPPTSPAITKWEPLPATVAETSEAKDPQTPAEDPPTESSATEAGSSPDQIQQIVADTDNSKPPKITQAVATDDLSTDEPSTDKPAVLSDDMTAQERMNLLMNNPNLEESTEVLEIKLLIPEKRFRKEDNGAVARVSYDDIDLLKILNMQPVPADADTYFPEWLSSLDGKRIRIRGFMIPPYQSEGLKRFALARDNGICCFVRTPKIYDVIDVRMAENQTTDYIANKPFDVEGIFRIQPFADDGDLYKLYKIEDAIVTE